MVVASILKLVTARLRNCRFWRRSCIRREFSSAPLQFRSTITLVGGSLTIPGFNLLRLSNYQFDLFYTQFSSFSGHDLYEKDINVKNNETRADEQVSTSLGSEDPPGYKDVFLMVSSARVTTIANKALSLGTTKTNEAFFGGRIRLNNKRIIKKKEQAEEGDTIDVILEITDSEVTLQRIRILVEEGTTSKGNEKFYIRKWRVLKLPLK